MTTAVVGELSGQVVVVTGAAGNLGVEMVRQLARSGAGVVGVDIAPADRLAHETLLEYVELDISDAGAVVDAFQDLDARYGRIDALVNNAAYLSGRLIPFLELDLEEWERTLSVCLMGAVHCTRAVLPAMRRARYGRIVNIGSDTTVLPVAGHTDYIAAKGAVVGLTVALAAEVAADGITVNAILPGLIPGDISRYGGNAETLAAVRAAHEQVLRVQAIPRLGEPGDLAPVIAFLAGPRSGWVTGQALAVNGGLRR